MLVTRDHPRTTPMEYDFEGGQMLRRSKNGPPRSMTRRAAAITELLCLSVLGTGCSNTSKNDESASAAIASSAVPPPDSASQPAAKATSQLTIEGFGLTILPRGTGPAKTVRFGESQAPTIAAISQVLGKPAQEGTNADCPSGPVQFATWSKGLSANFEGGKFVGWAGAVDQKTARGIGFGSSKADLAAAYHPTFEQTSLGYEFTADGITGVLESDAADAAITDLWAGMSCVAR